MARQFVYFMQGLTKSYPTRKVLDNVHLSFYPDAKIGVLGVNGSGKSTLLRIMAGLDKEYNGEAWVAEGARVGYLEQEPHLDETKTVRENVMLGVAKQKAILDRYNELAMNYSDETADEMTKLQDEIEAAGLWDLDSKVDQAMDALRCPPDDADVTKLSGGERRRVALCKLLLDQPELLLLDEPTNHLDAESVSWLEGHLRNYPGAILIVTHDRYFLDNVTGWILELDRGKGIPYEGNYSSWLVQKQKRLEQEGREDAAHQKTLIREQEWIASSPKARQAKSKARYQRYEDLLKQASEKQTQTAQITIPVAERLGQNVVDFEGLSKGFGDRLLIDDLTFKLPPGGIVGVIGPNGAGKTTLFRMITKQETPDKGTITVGESVHLGYVDQSRDDLDGKKNVWEEISGGNELILLGKREVNSRGYCSSFNFKGADQQKKVGALSGGERNRVHLAKMLKSGANVLLLDEPTNDLDVDTLRALEEALEDFAGCAVIISHDRWFLDRIATHILAFEDDSHVEWFEGNFQDYEKDKMRRLGQDSIIPHRVPVSRRFALEPGVDALDHLAIVVAKTVLGDVAEMRRQHEVVELAERMVDRQRLDREHVDAGARDLLLRQRFQQRAFVDDRPARGVDEVGGRLHAREIGRADQAARALAEHHMDGDDVGGGEQFLLGGVADADFLAFLGRQVRAPGDHVHAERLRQLRHLGAELAEAEHAERPALDLHADEFLQGFAGMHARVLAADIAGQFQDQAHGQGRGGIAAPLGAAQHHAMVLGGLHVDRGVAHARGDQEFQVRQRRKHRARKRRALAHRADDLEILQRAGGGLGGRKGLVEDGDVDPVGDLGPVRDLRATFEIVVENCTAQPRHWEVRSWRG